MRWILALKCLFLSTCYRNLLQDDLLINRCLQELHPKSSWKSAWQWTKATLSIDSVTERTHNQSFLQLIWNQENQKANKVFNHWSSRILKCILYYKRINAIEITNILNICKNCAEFMQTKISLTSVATASNGLQNCPFNV